MIERIVAIDPGDEHVGWALACVPGKVYDTGVHAPAEFLPLFRHWLSAADVVVVEEWRLYPNKAQALGGSDMPTSRLIGKIELMCEERGVDLVKYPANIKRPARARAKARNIAALRPTTIPGELRIHSLDAQLHAWWYMWNRERVHLGRPGLTPRQPVG